MPTPDHKYVYISTTTTTQVATGRSFLHGILVGTAAAGAIGVIDGITGTTVNVNELKASIAEGFYRFDCVMKAGIRIVTAANTKIIVIYSKP